MDIKNKNHGTSDMPSPKVMDYNSQYKLTPLFLSDLKIVLKNIPYVEFIKYFNYIEKYNGVFPSAILDGTETAALCIWDEIPYRSSFGYMSVIAYTKSANSTPSRQISNFLKL